ncbi:MAG TPA: 4Fe-4S dicluster domain-containing protein [Terracidiphilus sp.]|nr:4Fe-4S dicluster domain-containing protein [Terracidiphilus sp.]
MIEMQNRNRDFQGRGAAPGARGLLRVDVNECKGCGLCVQACPPKAIALSEGLNHYGYRTATYAGAGCTACGICFMVCPEPGAITVLRAVQRRAAEARAADEEPEEAMACASN